MNGGNRACCCARPAQSIEHRDPSLQRQGAKDSGGKGGGGPGQTLGTPYMLAQSWRALPAPRAPSLGSHSQQVINSKRLPGAANQCKHDSVVQIDDGLPCKFRACQLSTACLKTAQCSQAGTLVPLASRTQQISHVQLVNITLPQTHTHTHSHNDTLCSLCDSWATGSYRTSRPACPLAVCLPWAWADKTQHGTGQG